MLAVSTEMSEERGKTFSSGQVVHACKLQSQPLRGRTGGSGLQGQFWLPCPLEAKLGSIRPCVSKET